MEIILMMMMMMGEYRTVWGYGIEEQVIIIVGQMHRQRHCCNCYTNSHNYQFVFVLVVCNCICDELGVQLVRSIWT